MKKSVVPILCLGLIALAMCGMYVTAASRAQSADSRDEPTPAVTYSQLDDLQEEPPEDDTLESEVWDIPSQTIQADESGVLVIRERLFIQQCNDVYLNPDEYVGRTVRLEGIYDEFPDEESGETFRYVIRYGPGCCGNDGMAGFEFKYDGEASPRQDDWIEATGTVELAGPVDEEYVILRLSSLKIMDKRGAEFVSN
ncbi:MAG: hypothetical protein LBQ56_06785 [Synergistaceae bacterium]|nr:hypothetical protein [Synergistaceae bacterium]